MMPSSTFDPFEHARDLRRGPLALPSSATATIAEAESALSRLPTAEVWRPSYLQKLMLDCFDRWLHREGVFGEGDC
jgi:hypothetical protein